MFHKLIDLQQDMVTDFIDKLLQPVVDQFAQLKQDHLDENEFKANIGLEKLAVTQLDKELKQLNNKPESEEVKRSHCLDIGIRQLNLAIMYAQCDAVTNSKNLNEDLGPVFSETKKLDYATRKKAQLGYFLKYSTEAITNLLEAKKSSQINAEKMVEIDSSIEKVVAILKEINAQWTFQHPAGRFVEPLPIKVSHRGMLATIFKQVKTESRPPRQSICSKLTMPGRYSLLGAAAGVVLTGGFGIVYPVTGFFCGRLLDQRFGNHDEKKEEKKAVLQKNS